MGAFLGALYNFYLKRPKLQITGGGTGRAVHLRLRNKPGFIGIVIPDNTLLGLRINSRVEWGLTFDRSVARDCYATIMDDETEEAFTLWWVTGDQQVVHKLDLGPGESAELLLVTTNQAAPGCYYIWRPTPGPSIEPSPPPAHEQLKGSRQFTVRIVHSDGRRKITFPLKITRRLDGRYAYKHPGGGGMPI